MKRRILKKLMAFTMAVTVIAGSTVPALAEQTQNESVKIVTPQLEVVRKDGKIEGIKFINNSDAENVMMYDFCTEEEIELLKNGSMELETGVSMYSNEEYEISLASLWTVREIGEKDYLVTYCEDEDGNYSDLFVLEELYFSCTEKNMDTSISYGVGEISGNIYFPTISTKDYNWAAAKYMRSEPEADDDFAQEELSVMGEVYCLRTEEEYTYEVLETYAAKVSEKDGACLIEVENYTNIQKEDNYEEKVTDTPRLTVNSRNTVRGIYLENPGDMEVWAELYLVKEGEEVSTDIFLSSEYLEPGQKEYLPFEPIFHYADNVEPGNYSIVAMAYSEDYPESEWTVLEDFTVVFEEEAMESAKVGVGHSTGNYYFTDTNKDEWLYGNVVYEYTDDETEESKEYLYWTKGMLSLDAAYLNDAYDQWELKEANLYKMQYGKEQVQFSRCHTEKFELNVYEEPIPKAAQLELYREDDKVVGIKAKNVMDEDVYIEFYILNENVEEWMMGEILPAGGSAIILFNDINLSGISSGAYELKARVYDWDYEFYSDWINTGYALVIEDTTYTGKNVQVTKAYDEEYDSYLYNWPV